MRTANGAAYMGRNYPWCQEQTYEKHLEYKKDQQGK